jgi:hypothetical protein
MNRTPKQAFDIYRKTTDPTLRLATAAGTRLPPHFTPKDWRLMKGATVLHSDVPQDVAVKGYCYFQVLKG